jgi:hypothetical protein
VADPADEIVSSLDVELFTASHIITNPVYVRVIRSEDGHYQKTVWSVAYIICRPAWWIFAALVTYPSVYTAWPLLAYLSLNPICVSILSQARNKRCSEILRPKYWQIVIGLMPLLCRVWFLAKPRANRLDFLHEVCATA